MKTKKNISAQSIAFTALWRVEVQDAYADIVLDNLFKETKPPANARALATEIVYGTIRWKLLLDHYLKQVMDRPLTKVERRALLALRIGAYQLLLLDRVPGPAAVNESVDLAPKPASGFVNAVLRALSAKKNQLVKPESIADETERLSTKYSHPEWMVKEFTGVLGAENTARLLDANNRRPGLTLRVNTLRTGREMFLRSLAKAGIEAEPGRFSPLSVHLAAPMPPGELPGYEDGLFAVQDESSQLAPLLLQPQPGEYVLDACAAPGTKSLELMQLMSGKGRVIAMDIHEGRLGRMATEAKRLGVPNVTRVAADAAKPLYGEGSDEPLPEKFRGLLFDRALIDAPCTGLGAIRRRPEIKWRRKPEDLAAMSDIQRAIVMNVSRHLKPGGTLAYSTCTLTRAENEDAVAPLISSGRFELLDPASLLPALSPLAADKVVRTWPHLSGADGFTIFALKRRK